MQLNQTVHYVLRTQHQRLNLLFTILSRLFCISANHSRAADARQINDQMDPATIRLS